MAAFPSLGNLYVAEYSLLTLVRRIEEVSERLGKAAATSIEDEWRHWRDEERRWEGKDERVYWFVRKVREAHERERFIRVQHELLKIALAVAKHQADRGDVPQSLHSLVPEYLPTIGPLSSGRMPVYEVRELAAGVSDPSLAELPSPGGRASVPENKPWTIKRRTAPAGH